MTANVPASVRTAAQDYANQRQEEVVIFRTSDAYAGRGPVDYCAAGVFAKYPAPDCAELERVRPTAGKTHTVEITVGGPAYGAPFAAYAKSDTARWLNACIGLGDTPEAANTDARMSVELDASRCGYTPRFVYPREN